MSMIDHFNHLGSIWYHSQPLEVPYSPEQFLGWDFFAVSYSKPALVHTIIFKVYYSKNDLTQILIKNKYRRYTHGKLLSH